MVIQAPQSGTLSLDGTSVQYAPATSLVSTLVAFSFYVQENRDSITPVITVIVGGNGSRTITGAASGYTDVALGSGNSIVALHGIENTVYLGNGNDTVTATGGDNNVTTGKGNSKISLGGGGNSVAVDNGNNSIALSGSGSAVTLGNGIDTLHGGTGDIIR